MSGVRSSGSLTGHWPGRTRSCRWLRRPARETFPQVNTWLTTIVTATMTVFAASSGTAQTEPGQAPVDSPILSESLASTEVPSDDDRSSAEGEQRRSFPRDVAGDIWRFFSTPSTYATLGLGLAASLGVKSLDANAVPAFEPLPPDYDADPDDVFKPGNLLGSTAVQFGGALTTYGIGAWANKPGVAELGRDLVRAQLLGGGFAQLVKLTVRRTRPDGYRETSFPSGHTAGTFASATVLSRHYGWKVGVPAFTVASYVAASRIGHHEHYLSDVVFGAAIGLTAGRTVTFGHGTTRFEVSPMAMSRGIGVQVSVVEISVGGAM